jgi:hypothetical protein
MSFRFSCIKFSFILTCLLMKFKKLVFKPEKLKFKPLTFGFVKLNLLGSPFFESLSISAPAVYFNPITFPYLSKASPTASSNVFPNSTISK